MNNDWITTLEKLRKQYNESIKRERELQVTLRIASIFLIALILISFFCGRSVGIYAQKQMQDISYEKANH